VGWLQTGSPSPEVTFPTLTHWQQACNSDRLRVAAKRRWQHSEAMRHLWQDARLLWAALPFLSVSVAWTSKMSPDPPRTSGPSSPWSENSKEGNEVGLR
jgi:hypothetical protein